MRAIGDVMQRAVSVPAEIQRVLEPPLDPDDDGVLHASPELLVAFAVFPPGFATGIHDHGTPAVIGAWAAHENNLLYRRTATGLEAVEPKRVHAGEVLVLGADAVHDVHAPTSTWCGALHVYLGDITTTTRSFWPDAAGPATPFSGDRQEQAWLEAAHATNILAQD